MRVVPLSVPVRAHEALALAPRLRKQVFLVEVWLSHCSCTAAAADVHACDMLLPPTAARAGTGLKPAELAKRRVQ